VGVSDVSGQVRTMRNRGPTEELFYTEFSQIFYMCAWPGLQCNSWATLQGAGSKLPHQIQIGNSTWRQVVLSVEWVTHSSTAQPNYSFIFLCMRCLSEGAIPIECGVLSGVRCPSPIVAEVGDGACGARQRQGHRHIVDQ
jgi:hypothetical protein